ncbi:MAG: FMN-binding glutamate synthase family protein [Spirochaetes bacterium]|nr:FMN-binding glutamate synthase family protein [Spirochaetota bacterium]
MNLQRPNAGEATHTANRSRDVVPCSGICTICLDGCQGNCEIFKASFRGREVIYPGPFGEMTAGGNKDYPIDYSHLNIQGYALGAEAIEAANPDIAIFPKVETESSFGHIHTVRMALPVFTGALGSTEIARRNWDEFAAGAAIAGIPLVCGENVCGVDPDLKLKDGKIVESPEMKRRVETYHRWHDLNPEYGDIIVQMNVEDSRFGVAEYVTGKLGVKTIELKWGQGAKCIGGEIKIKSLEDALELRKRGYIVEPNPALESVQKAFKVGAITSFERHSRLGFIHEDTFLREVEKLRRQNDITRITLKTGAYGARELAMAIKWASKARLDLVTIDGAPGGTGMSPWRMMVEWGVPTFYLQCLAYEFCMRLASKGEWVPSLAMAGGFSTEDHIFKVLAMGSPFFKAVCMGRGLMIPGMVGKNIGEWIKKGKLPKTVGEYGDTPEKIFVTYELLKQQLGASVMKELPLGAVGVYTFTEKMKLGLQELMAGTRSFRVDKIVRKDLMALTPEAAEVSGISYVMDAYREQAEEILDS